MGTTYIQLTREEFEEWLGTLGHRWHLKPGKVGVYVVTLSERVAIEVASSMTGREEVMSRAQASMGVKPVSLITGFVLNKKAQEQSHVKRTINWRDNLRKVFDRMLDAYRRSESFYEALAEIKDRDKYKTDILAKIEGLANGQGNTFLSDLHKRVGGGGILTHRQLEALERAAKPPEVRVQSPGPSNQLPWLRALWAVAKAEDDTAAMRAAERAADMVKSGRPLPDADSRNVRELISKYRKKIDEWMKSHGEKSGRVAARWLELPCL